MNRRPATPTQPAGYASSWIQLPVAEEEEQEEEEQGAGGWGRGGVHLSRN